MGQYHSYVVRTRLIRKKDNRYYAGLVESIGPGFFFLICAVAIMYSTDIMSKIYEKTERPLAIFGCFLYNSIDILFVAKKLVSKL